jgi:hypothetical protein
MSVVQFLEEIAENLESQNVPYPGSRDGHGASVADLLGELALATDRVALAITPDASPGTDASGGVVMSLTEAVMGITSGLHSVAESISDLAQAVRENSPVV